jgi:hypothetical protein
MQCSATIKRTGWSMSILAVAVTINCGSTPTPPRGHSRDLNPYQPDIICRQSQARSVQGKLYKVTDNRDVLISTFNKGHVGSCEFAKRSSRNGLVCIEKDYRYHALEISSNNVIKSFDQDFSACTDFTKNWEKLVTREGFVQFIDSAQLSNSLANLPQVSDSHIDEVLRDPDTMWYDEESMVFAYQDSFGAPTGPEGLRANRVAYDTGINSSVPDIRLLTDFFEPEKFKFPFSVGAGDPSLAKTYVVNFWAPPRDEQNKVLPVVWWKNKSHWHWTFPVGTVIGEVLLMQDSQESGEWFVFEIRSRLREVKGWKADIFRPFSSAIDMAEAIKLARPNWRSTDLLNLVQHLESPSSLSPARLESKPFAKIFKAIVGYNDYLPPTEDRALIKEFLSKRIFESAMDKHWKSNGDQVTYAPASRSSFHIVPTGYVGGLLPTNESACSVCHDQTGRPLGQVDGRVVLYGEIWGEDQIFTWHPFKPVIDMFTVSNASRIPNPRMIQAGLILQRKPGANELNYRELPRPYPPVYGLD